MNIASLVDLLGFQNVLLTRSCKRLCDAQTKLWNCDTVGWRHTCFKTCPKLSFLNGSLHSESYQIFSPSFRCNPQFSPKTFYPRVMMNLQVYPAACIFFNSFPLETDFFFCNFWLKSRVHNRKKSDDFRQYRFDLNLVPGHCWHELWRICQSQTRFAVWRF